jgi:hypothetical protein
MPTLKLMSVYNARKRKFATELAQARADLDRFKATLLVRFGKETVDAIRQHVRWTEDMFFGRVEVLPLPQEAEGAVKTLQAIIESGVAVLRNIREPDCWFREKPTPISVLETVGLSWGAVQTRCSEDGYLPVCDVLWLLNILRSTEQIMPSDEQVWEWAGETRYPCHLPHEWQQLLRGRKRRLVGLLERAAELGEEVRCGF